MTKLQKAGFVLSAVIFISMGLIFLFFGFKSDNSVLKFMGYFWFPAGLLQLTIVMFFLHKKKA